MEKDYSILIGGAAGQGSRKAGFIIAKIFARLGYKIFIYDDYQSLIRGGHSFSQIRASEEQIFSHRQKIDFLVALDENTIEQHKDNLDKKGAIIYNNERVSKKFSGVGIPAKTIVEKSQGGILMENSAMVGAFCKAAGISWGVVEEILKKEFKKFQEVNLKIAKTAFELASNLRAVKSFAEIENQLLLTGNQAVALGAIRAGLDFYISYPMTPATSILNFLAQYQKDFNIRVIQPENELAVINMAIGANYAGKKIMVGTSGGGFALMTEALSLAVQAEIPIVIVESQRAGPATGVPTYNAQGDLLFVLNAGHGDIVKFTVAPSNAQECFFWSEKILNLSWKYQTPSILLLDKQVSESTFSFNPEGLEKIRFEKFLLWDGKGEYMRYKNTDNGISPLAFPGDKKATVKATSYEHDEFGITTEDEKEIKKMQDKRLRKFQEMKKEIEELPTVNIYGNEQSDKAIVCWGSTVGPAKEAAEKLNIKLIQIVVIQPFPEQQVKKALEGVKELILAEANALGQMEKVLNSYSIKVNRKILKYDSRPFTAEEIIKRLRD